MSSVDIHPEELLDKLERATLSPAERTRLDAHLAVCDVCRFELALRGDLDEDVRVVRDRGSSPQASPVPVQKAPSVPPSVSRARLRRWGVAWGLAAALLVLAAASLASYATRGVWPWAAPVAATNSATPIVANAGPAAHHHKKAGPSPAVPPTPADAVSTSVPEAVNVRSAVPRAPREASAGATQETAATLFSAANQARRAGDVQRAIEHYRKLQRRFPTAQESLVSRVTLGRLLLGMDVSGALSEFDSYLAAGAPTLAAEAWVGRAHALSSLGRHEESRAAWREVLSRYPQSVYAEEARSTLGLSGSP